MEENDNDSIMESSTDSLDIKYQKELVYNKLLPYADELEVESQAFLAEIKGNLGRTVMLRELYPGAAIWSKRLYFYIDVYGYKFTKEDHILFVKLIYELLTIPKLHQNLVENFAYTLRCLLRKTSLISPDELELPWKPIYQLYYQMKHTAESDIIYHYEQAVKHLLYSVIRLVKVYFPLSATQEILEELRPTLCPFDQISTDWGIESLELFLPLELRPQHHSFGFHLWFEELMDFWEKCNNSPSWESKIMWLMGRLAYNNIGYVNWEPYLPLMFTRILRSLHLPVSYQKVPNRKKHNIGTCPVAFWIVSVLGKNSKAQTYLDKFLKTVETYYRSANCGRWTTRLQELLKMPHHFISRLQKERYRKPTWAAPIPEDAKLTDDDIDAFVKSVVPIAMTAMYSITTMDEACTALRHLANIRPNLVIPGVLERMYSTLDSVTEPHKLTAAMMSVISVARPMVQGHRNINKGYTFSEGPIHVMPLLFSFLPGIDPNDSQKTYVTFRLLNIFSMLIPIVDCSRSTEIMDEEDRMICESTSRFEDFILQFLDRMFLLIDSSSLEFVRLESRGEDKKSQAESLAESIVAGVCTSLLAQTSDQIFDCALHKLRVFISERILETRVAGQLAAVLCKTFAKVNGRSTLRALFPFLSQTILDTVTENEDILKDESLDNRLLYCMLILTGVLDTPGNNLIPYIDTLQKILDRVLYLKSKEGSNLAGKMLNFILYNLSNIVPCKFQTCERDYNDPEYAYIKDWGQAPCLKSLKLDWYVPAEQEISIVQGMFSRYLLPEIHKLQKYCEDPNSLTREELFLSLNIVNIVISNCEPLLPVWKESPIVLEETCSPSTPFIPTSGSKGELLMPDGSNVRCYMANFMYKLQKVMLENAEDDTKSLGILIQIWSSLLLGRNRTYDRYGMRYRMLKQLKTLWEDKLTKKGKSYMGSAILVMAAIIHEKHMQVQSHVVTETHKRMILQLFQLATSRYADVRMKAQSSLFKVMHIIPDSRLVLVPCIIDILGKDTETHHDAYKGALYTSLGPLQTPLITTPNWHVLKSLWPAIILSKPSEKLSVIRLKDAITERVHKRFFTTGIELDVPQSCVTVASSLWDSELCPLVSQPNEADIEEGLRKLESRNESNVEAYKELLDRLQNAILEKTLHWRHRLMAMNFIRNAVSPEQVYPSNVVRYFLGALIHDSLPERKIAIRIVACILKQQKRKHPKITVDVSMLSKKFTSPENQSETLNSFGRSDNLWLQYDYDTRPLTAEQWDEPRYVHLAHIGYYAWPKKLEVYAPSYEQPTLDPNIRKLSKIEAEVDLFFNNAQNVERLIQLFSLDGKKGAVRFDTYRFVLFQGLFRNHGDVYLRHFVPLLEKLIADKQEDSLTLAAEITAGIIRGSKHWPFQMVRDMWTALLPIVKSALANLTVEVVNDWCQCLLHGLMNRDPNRNHWILEFLMEASRPDPTESSFVECIRLTAVDDALGIYSWRVSQLFGRLLKQLEDRLLSNPFNNVRECVAHGLATVFASELRSFDTSSTRLTERVRKFMEKVTPTLQQLADDLSATFNTEEEALSLRVADVKLNDPHQNSTMSGKEREKAISLLKSACSLIAGVVERSQYGLLPEFYEWFPIICQLKNYETDKELARTCTNTLAILAYTLTLPCDMPIALDAVTKISKNPSWWTRITCLEFLQVLVFTNMSIILSNSVWVGTVQDIVLCLLNDDRLEVREKAAEVLGGLLHCAFIPDSECLLENFKKKAKTKLHRAKNIDERENNAKMHALRIRHAGVLGLCAFIQAHPYDVPKYLPPIFEHLGYHLGDPQPIPATIRKTMANFKRTHYDGWYGVNGHAQQFTEDQLTVLQDLSVPPSDYA